MKKLVRLLLSMLLVAGLLTGCGDSAIDSDESTQETVKNTGDKTQLRVATFDTAAWNVAFNTARGAGYFDEEFADSNIELSFVPFGSGPAVNEAFLAGEVDMVVGMGDQPIISALAAGEVDNLVVAKSAEVPNMGIAVAKDSGITSVEELRSKTVAVPIGMAFHKALLYILSDAGIGADEVEYVNITSYDEVIAAIDSGDIDAGFCWSTGYVNTIESDNYEIIADAAEHPMYTYILSTRTYVEEHEEAVKKFLSVVERGAELFENEPDTAYQYIADVIGADFEITKKSVEPNKASLKLDTAAIENLYDTSDFLVDQELISSGVDSATVDDHISLILNEIE